MWSCYDTMKPAGVQTLRSTFVALPHLLNTQRNARRRDPEYTNTQESDGSVICAHTHTHTPADPATHKPSDLRRPVNIQPGGAASAPPMPAERREPPKQTDRKWFHTRLHWPTGELQHPDPIRSRATTGTTSAPWLEGSIRAGGAAVVFSRKETTGRLV